MPLQHPKATANKKPQDDAWLQGDDDYQDIKGSSIGNPGQTFLPGLQP